MHRSGPTPLPLLALILSLLAGAARADEPDPPAPLTSYAAGPLRQATLVVVGTTRSVRTQRQQQIARVDVADVLRGKPPSRPLTVFVRGPHPASRLADRDATGFPGVGAGRHVYFLALRPTGVACDFRDAFEAEGARGEAKIAALREEIRLAGIEEPERRARETLAHLLAGLGSKSPWTRSHAAREMLRFVRARRDLIDPALEARLRERLRMRIPRDERTHLRAVVKHLDQTPRPERPAAEPVRKPGAEAASDPWRRAWEKASRKRRAELVPALLERPRPEDLDRAFWALGSAAPETRRLILRALTDLGRPALLARMLRLYAGEEDLSVRTELVRAVGMLGGDADVPWLAERAESRLLERAALLGLARIRSDAAKTALRVARKRIEAAAEPGSAGRLRWIDYLLSDDFEASTLMR